MSSRGPVPDLTFNFVPSSSEVGLKLGPKLDLKSGCLKHPNARTKAEYDASVRDPQLQEEEEGMYCTDTDPQFLQHQCGFHRSGDGTTLTWENCEKSPKNNLNTSKNAVTGHKP
jgi:hypothetical protein